MMANLNHVALLVNNIEEFVQKNNLSDKPFEQIEEFPSEGTRELYIGNKSQTGKLLLMQAIGKGPYKEALEKRGAGLHHIAIDVPKVDDFVGELAGSGWYLHPKSLWFYDDSRMAFLTRPGVPVLIEVMERPQTSNQDHFIDSIEFPFPEARLREALSCSKIKMGKQFELLIDGQVVSPFF